MGQIGLARPWRHREAAELLTRDCLVIGAIVEVMHPYENGTMSPWKQAIVQQLRPEIVVQIAHSNGIQEFQAVHEPHIRAAKILVRNVMHEAEFEHLKGKGHGQQFCSTSVVSADHFVVRYTSGAQTLVIGIGPGTNVIGGSTHDIGSGFQAYKNCFHTEKECGTYIRTMQLEYMMDEYAELFRYRPTKHVGSNQLEVLTRLFEDWRKTNNAGSHNEVLVNLHPDMVMGVLAPTGDSEEIRRVRESFASTFRRQIPMITMHGRLFVVVEDGVQ